MADNQSTDPTDADAGVDATQSLVRPYIRQYERMHAGDEPAVASDGELSTGRPAQHSRTPAHAASPKTKPPSSTGTAARPATEERRGRRILLVAGCGALILGLAVIALAASDNDPSAGPGPAAPGASAPGRQVQTAGPPNTSTPASTSPSGHPSEPTGTSGTGATSGPPGTPPRTPSQSPGSIPAVAPPGPSQPASGTTRTGRIASVAGLCLEGSVGNNKNGGQVRLWDCDGTAGQVWTVADNGTVQALGQCLEAATGLVRLRDCDGAAGQQWRAGSSGSLVNDASRLCLGDPEGGAVRGTPQRTAPCDQSEAQRWTLP